MKRLSDYPIYIQVMAMPFMWIVAVFKILYTIPIVIIGKCNDIANKFESL